MKIKITCIAENEYECDEICKLIDDYFHFKELKKLANIDHTGYHSVHREDEEE